jgi:hypothetical protein
VSCAVSVVDARLGHTDIARHAGCVYTSVRAGSATDDHRGTTTARPGSGTLGSRRLVVHRAGGGGRAGHGWILGIARGATAEGPVAPVTSCHRVGDAACGATLALRGVQQGTCTRSSVAIRPACARTGAAAEPVVWERSGRSSRGRPRSGCHRSAGACRHRTIDTKSIVTLSHPEALPEHARHVGFEPASVPHRSCEKPALILRGTRIA